MSITAKNLTVETLELTSPANSSCVYVIHLFIWANMNLKRNIQGIRMFLRETKRGRVGWRPSGKAVTCYRQGKLERQELLHMKVFCKSCRYNYYSRRPGIQFQNFTSDIFIIILEFKHFFMLHISVWTPHSWKKTWNSGIFVYYFHFLRMHTNIFPLYKGFNNTWRIKIKLCKLLRKKQQLKKKGEKQVPNFLTFLKCT